jgi:hypothetical protein
MYKKAKTKVDNVTKPNTSALSNQEIVNGLKEALNIGSQNSSNMASKVDGFYKNPTIKIPFPPEAKVMEQRLRNMGMGAQVDKFVVALNRAAEDAAKSAAPVFKSAVTGMTINDGMGILKGGDNAATNYLKNTTSPELKSKFKPIVSQSLQKVSVTQYWTPLVTAYNRIPMVEKKNPDLNAYVTEKGLEGLFFLVSQEELKIRKDPAARVTDLLKKVFSKQ